ncbi:MAG: hypothetical protein KAI67_05455 [Candidatus Pacebacteria bacterium]|nr:hypothetical protein [Candidatus Paceibacterota bacterium]
MNKQTETIELPKTTMPNLSALKAYEERNSFALVAVRMEEETDKIIITIPDDPLVAINKEDRRVMEFTRNNFYRAAAGGLLIILEKKDGEKIATTILRDNKAPTYPNHLTSCTGLSACFEEVLNPELVTVREGLEELVFKISGTRIVLPVFDDSMSEINIRAIIKDGASLRPATEECPLVECQASIFELPGQKTTEVYWKGKLRSKFSSIIVIDEGVNGIDCLGAIKIKVPIDDWNELEIFDGEVIGGRNLLNRDIYAYDFYGNIILGWKSGKIFTPQKKTSFPQTPVLREVMKVLIN